MAAMAGHYQSGLFCVCSAQAGVSLVLHECIDSGGSFKIQQADALHIVGPKAYAAALVLQQQVGVVVVAICHKRYRIDKRQRLQIVFELKSSFNSHRSAIAMQLPTRELRQAGNNLGGTHGGAWARRWGRGVGLFHLSRSAVALHAPQAL
jgi:hypothetical protein